MNSCSWFIHWYSCWCVSLCQLCGVLLYASVGGFCYISRRSKESSHKPSSLADPFIVYDEVGTNKKMKGDAMR